MLDLLATAKQNEFSMNHFQNIVKKYVPQGIKNELSMFITQGKTIPLEDLLGTLPLEKILMGPFDLGFNKKIFKEHKIIKNIDEKSNAYQAGLRNGDKIIGWDFPKGSEGNEPDQIVEIKTTNKIIKFRPESKKQKLVYQFSSSLSEADKNKIREFFGAQQQLRR
jgi:predicted metalloprotease with PDZ domain